MKPPKDVVTAVQRVAALSGEPEELDEGDVAALARTPRYNLDGDPTTLNEAELDRFLDDNDVDLFDGASIIKNVVFSSRVCGTDKKLSPQEAVAGLLGRYTDGEELVVGVSLRAPKKI